MNLITVYDVQPNNHVWCITYVWWTKLFTDSLIWIYIVICNSPRKHERWTVMLKNSRLPLAHSRTQFLRVTSLRMCSWSLSSKCAEELWVEIAFSSKNALKFSYIPRTSREWNKLPAEVVLSPSLPVSRRKLLWTAIQKSLVNNMCFFYYVLLFFLFFIFAIFYWIKDEFYNVT